MLRECQWDFTGFSPSLQDYYRISAKSHKIPVQSHEHSCKNWGANHHGGLWKCYTEKAIGLSTKTGSQASTDISPNNNIQSSRSGWGARRVLSWSLNKGWEKDDHLQKQNENQILLDLPPSSFSVIVTLNKTLVDPGGGLRGSGRDLWPYNNGATRWKSEEIPAEMFRSVSKICKNYWGPTRPNPESTRAKLTKFEAIKKKKLRSD